MMGLSFAAFESALCVMSTILKHDWLLFAVSLCGPVALGVGAYLVMNKSASTDRDAAVAVKTCDLSYRFLLILSSVYVVTYGFYYAVVQLLLKT
jgi:hypothetical protein